MSARSFVFARSVLFCSVGSLHILILVTVFLLWFLVCIDISGFVELLSRISSMGKFATIPASVTSAAGGELVPSVATIETLLRIMDSSGGINSFQ